MTTPSHFVDPVLVDRYFTKTASAADLTTLARQLGVSAADLEQVAVERVLRYNGTTVTGAVFVADRATLLRRISGERMVVPDAGDPTSVTINGRHIDTNRRGPSPLGVRMSAVWGPSVKPRGFWTGVVVFGVLSAAFMFLGQLHEQPVGTDITQYATTSGQRRSVMLQDGTRIELAPQTTITVPPDFGRGIRTLELIGEASFDVKHTTGAPFIVRTGSVTTRVLGTVFSVRWDRESDPTIVMVTSGRVESRAQTARVVVEAGMTARLTDSTIATSSTKEVSQYIDWERDQLVFKRIPVRNVLQTLGRWYDCEFQLLDTALAATPVTIAFKIANRNDMLLVLQSTLNLTITDKGNVVVLKPRSPIESMEKYSPTQKHRFTPFTGVGK